MCAPDASELLRFSGLFFVLGRQVEPFARRVGPRCRPVLSAPGRSHAKLGRSRAKLDRLRAKLDSKTAFGPPSSGQTALPATARTLKIELPCRRELNFHVFAVLGFNADFLLNLEGLVRLLGSTWSLLGASWAQLGRSWAQLGLNLGALGRNLGAFGPSLGPFGAILGALGAILDALGASLDALGGNLGALGGTLDALGVNLGPTWTYLRPT